MRLKKLNWQIALSILIFISSAYLIFFSNKKLFSQTENPIGTVDKKQETLRRKSKNDLEWEQIYREQKLYSGDRIFTGPLAAADIDFIDGLRINLGEYTLIQVNVASDTVDLEVGQGNLTIEKTGGHKKTIVKIGKRQILLNELGTRIDIQRKNNDFTLNVQSGSAQVLGENGSTLIAGETYEYKNRNEPQVAVAVTEEKVDRSTAEEETDDYIEDDRFLVPAKKSEPVVEVSSIKNTMVTTFEKPTNQFSFNAGFGFSYNTYKDSIVSINQMALTPKASIYFSFDKNNKYRLAANAFFSFFSLNKSQIQLSPLIDPNLVDQVTVQNLGLNLRFIYLTPWLKNDWKMHLSAGWYYNSMFVTNSYFGYSGLNGPQLFPSIEKTFSNLSRAGTYLKFSPISGSGAVLNILSNYEAAMGFYYSFPNESLDGSMFSLTFDYAYLSVFANRLPITSNSSTLGASISF